MAITMPKIDITFEQRAVSLIGRSERGVAILIVRDDTNKTFTHKQYSDLSAAQADESLYTADNYAAICDMLGFAPYQAHVFRCDADGRSGGYTRRDRQARQDRMADHCRSECR